MGLFSWHGPPGYTRSDNGGEFTATAAREWLIKVGLQTSHIAPGLPWENACKGSVDGKLREQLLNGNLIIHAGGGGCVDQVMAKLLQHHSAS